MTAPDVTSLGHPVAKLAGYAPALPTPFTADDTLDTAAFEALCARQVTAGAAALVVGGTTGEAATLRPGETETLVRIAAAAARGRIPVIAGAGSNATAHAVALSRSAQDAGADAILSVVPYYNKPTQAGLLHHFTAIARAVDLPVFLYDVPGRSACALADETVIRLAQVRHIVGLKDATGDVTRPRRLRAALGPDFRLLSGDDASALSFMLQGGDGCISVTSNVVPGLCRNLFMAVCQGHLVSAQRWAQTFEGLTTALLRESNPAPLKHVLNLLGLMRARTRLPLVGVSETTAAALSRELGLLSRDWPEQLIARIDRPMHVGASGEVLRPGSMETVKP